jgi:predicted transposase/invertase (TIGR01784 family)
MTTSPHDALFKAALGRPEHARGVLHAVMPVALAETLDWSTLTLQPGSFVDSTLAAQHTDLLYSAASRDGAETLVYVLFEHQSTLPTEGLMAFRLLRYQVRIWERWRADHPNAKTLPIIVPVVMYHGQVRWSEPLSFDALLDVPAAARPGLESLLVRFAYLLYDLSEISDDELRQSATTTALAKLVMICFKHARTREDFIEILSRWMDVMREVARAPNGLEALAQVMRYILEVNEHVGPEALQALVEREIGPEAKDTIVTAGQQLLKQGIEQGRQQGIEQGIEQGRQQGIVQGRVQGIEQGRVQGIEQGRVQGVQEMLLRLLRRRFDGEMDVRIEQHIATATLDQLETWFERALSAARLADVFTS